MKLKGNNALITGASKGIGRAIALAFAREGADLTVTGRTKDELESLQAEVTQMGNRCVVIAGDLAERGVVDQIYTAPAQNLAQSPFW